MIRTLNCLLVILLVMFTFIGCTANADDVYEEQPEVSVNLPSDDSVNGYKLESETEKATSSVGKETQSVDEILYYANTTSKKFHKSTCTYAQRTNNENLYITENREELINENYAACKVCNP